LTKISQCCLTASLLLLRHKLTCEAKMKITGSLGVALLIILSLPIVCYAPTVSADFTDTEKAYAFLTDVVQLDLSKYQPQIKHVGTLSMGGIGLIDEVHGSLLSDYVFPDGGSSVTFDFIVWLKQGVPYYLSLSGGQRYIAVYSEKQPDNALDMAKGFLGRYQQYLIKYCNVDTAYLQPMIDMLNSVTELSPTNATSGKILMEISSGLSPSMQQISKIPSTYVKFDYTENGVDVSRRRVSLDYVNNTISNFHDSWNLYRIGAWSQISEQEAINIAASAAQKYVSENNFQTTPDLSDVTYRATLSMVPRENNVLYPSWEVIIFYNKPISNNIGIQVIIRGDTKEVTYTESYTVLGTPNYESSTPATSQIQTTNSPVETSNSKQPETGIQNQVLPIILVFGLMAIIATTAFYGLYRRRAKEDPRITHKDEGQ